MIKNNELSALLEGGIGESLKHTLDDVYFIINEFEKIEADNKEILVQKTNNGFVPDGETELFDAQSFAKMNLWLIKDEIDGCKKSENELVNAITTFVRRCQHLNNIHPQVKKILYQYIETIKRLKEIKEVECK